ncbi:hypothetical protein JQ617_02670 [Bradyrhizobium sp. KB893862 SZCCT0404]|uniref:hypothetical protein n=1 Tax=Bradyrhizobium sp. KB893862 SZCCT0404 TaxID=2807672 RepID=UPI001BA898A9|nr:hypothetical protein [Bradyrhizobium sp. KB893862 SZCCT0404]MBR1172846.1 hypothetical protein [Bradyrhizobium sp. KB893862 SZCCT0404]
MPIWTTTAEEYEHARKIVLEATDFGGKKVVVHLTSGDAVTGWMLGSNSGTDVSENMAAKRGPVVTKMYGEIKLLTEAGHTIILEAVAIKAFRDAK